MSEDQTTRQRKQEEASNPATSDRRLKELSLDPQLRIRVASNSAAPSSLLEKLAGDQDSLVRRAVAGNPNTPWHILEKLASEFPYAFLHNPFGPLQLLASPQHVTTNSTFWNNLLRSTAIPSLWWNWLQNHMAASVHQAMHLHVQHAGEAASFAGIPQKEDDHILFLLLEMLEAARLQHVQLPSLPSSIPVRQTSVPGEQIIGDHLQWLARSDNQEVRQAVASHLQTPAEILHMLAQDAHVDVRWTVARHPHLPEETARLLARDYATDVRSAVAWNAQTPVEVLCLLAQDRRQEIRCHVARHVQTPLDILQTLALNPQKRVRRSVASHPRTPAEILRSLALDHDSGTRYRVARHKQTPADILRKLAQDHSADVRCSVAGNQQTPVDILLKLAHDPAPHVRSMVAMHNQIPAEALHILAQDSSIYTRWVVARHRNTPMDVLQRLLARDRGAPIAIAGNEQAPPEILQKLARDYRDYVRERVANNPRTPPEVLQKLAQDAHMDVREKVASNPCTLPETLKNMALKEPTKKHWLASAVSELLPRAEEPPQEENWREILRSLYLCERLSRVSLAMQLELIAAPTVPEHRRQTLLGILASDWDNIKVQAIFATDQAREMPKRERDVAVISPARKESYRHIMAPFMHPLALQKLAASHSWEIRYLVALHPQTPWHTRQDLYQDGNRYVRAMARAQSATLPEITSGCLL